MRTPYTPNICVKELNDSMRVEIIYMHATIANGICVYDLKMAGKLRAMTWTLHVDLLSHCVMYTLCPGNSTVLRKQQLKTKVHGAYHNNTQARQPFARIVIVNGNLLRSKVRIRQKMSSANYLTAFSSTQKNATHRMLQNTVS